MKPTLTFLLSCFLYFPWFAAAADPQKPNNAHLAEMTANKKEKVNEPESPASAPTKKGKKAQDDEYPPVIKGTKSEVYRKVGETELKVWIFEPDAKVEPSQFRPAIVFFFGGSWFHGSPAQFAPQSRVLAQRGMIAIVADYRVASRHEAKPADCVSDAKACIRWVRANSARLGIDPDRIAAGGGSAGGHLAAAAATLPGLDTAADDKSVSCRPNALVLFNPATVLAPYPGLEQFDNVRELRGLDRKKFGCEPEEISPIHHVRKGIPPTIIFHGKDDTKVPYTTAQKFAEVMTKAGNRCELVGFAGEDHGFFRRNKYDETLSAADAFLVSLGYLPATK